MFMRPAGPKVPCGDTGANARICKMDNKQSALLAEIEVAFAGVSRLGGISLHEATAIDDYAMPEQRTAARQRDTESRWQDVPDEHIAQNYSVFSFLDDIGRAYYAPAYMSWLVRTGYATQSNSIDGILFALNPCHEWGHILTAAQCKAVAGFLAYVYEVLDEKSELSEAKESLDLYWGQYLRREDR